jgi:hypothetical protein
MWTYDPTQLTTSALFQLRLLIGDTLQKDPQMQDEELGWLMTQRSSIYGAAADACRSLAAQMSRQADSTQGNLHTLYSSRARAYAASAGRYEVQAMARSAGLPYGGQMSQADYNQMLSNPDRMGPQFSIGMDDSFLPVGPLNSENVLTGEAE